jgi:hypothetical protein
MKEIAKALYPTLNDTGELEKRPIEGSNIRTTLTASLQHKQKGSRRPVLTLKHLNVLLQPFTDEIDERPLDITLKEARPKLQYRQSKRVRLPHIDVPPAAVVIEV